MVIRFLAAALAVALIAGCATSPAPHLAVSSNPALFGGPLSIQVRGLEPGARIRVRAERPAPWRGTPLYRSQATFVADEQGLVDMALDGPVEDWWEPGDADALFWGMRPTAEDPPPDLGKDDVRITVLTENDRILTQDVIALRATRAELVETPLGEEFPGAFVLRRPGTEPLPAVVVLGGSEGGDSAARRYAPLFAARGYAAVGYPYYSPSWGGSPAISGLPGGFANLPIDKLIDVRNALRARPDVDGNRIALHGSSKGAEFVLAAASRIDGFAAVAAIVPSDVIWEGWGPGHSKGETPGFSWQGEPLAFVPYVGIDRAIGRVDEDERVALRVPHAEGRNAHPDRVAAARIRVEDIDEPVFLLGGGRDQTWDSGRMAANIAKTRADAGLATETLIFAKAGHGLGGPPEMPAGSEEAVARAAAWPALLDFLDRNLSPDDAP